MSAPTRILPAPPDGDTRWSVVTLAAFLCLPAAVVHAELFPPDDFHSRRLLAHYQVRGSDHPDFWLTGQAAERVAAAFPVGMLARRVVADQPEAAALLGWDQIRALADHIVDHLGGGAR